MYACKNKRTVSYDWNKKVYLILSDGWVYERYLDTITDVLNEVDGLLEDFILLRRNLINLQHIRMTVSAYVFMKNSNRYKTVDATISVYVYVME